MVKKSTIAICILALFFGLLIVTRNIYATVCYFFVFLLIGFIGWLLNCADIGDDECEQMQVEDEINLIYEFDR